MAKHFRFSSVFIFLVCALAYCLPGSLQVAAQTADGRSLGDIARAVRAKQRTEVRVTAEDAKEFFTSLDQILDFASKDTGFPKRSAVKHQLIGRDRIDAYTSQELSKQVEEDRLGRSELVLKKLGLLPPDFALKTFLLKAVGQQMAGYYDLRDKTMYLLNWVPLELQRPVMAHELTHALQDQNYDLSRIRQSEASASAKAKSVSMSVSGTDEDEHGIAQRAVLEGQAMVVFIDYLLQPRNITLANSPDAQDIVSNNLDGYDLSINLHDAPRVLKESTMFPYNEGLAFEVELLRRGGKSKAFAGPFARVPSNTHQILHPDAYLAKTATPGVKIPDLRPILAGGFELLDSGMIGELDARIMAREFGRENDLFTVAANWNGGGYVAVKRIGIPDQKLTSSDVSLLYVSRWKTPKAAKRFAEIYKTALMRRVTVSHEQTSDNTDCVQSAPCKGPLWSSKLLTSEGTDYIEILPNNTVMIAQSFDEAMTSRLRELIFNPATAQLSTSNMHELSLSLYESPAFLGFQEKVLGDLKTKLSQTIGQWTKSTSTSQAR
ncbi:MAG: hypothetical protein ABSD96_17055 [Candidatus Korobacteraceae bacterium]|jgi:hypothetical protein